MRASFSGTKPVDPDPFMPPVIVRYRSEYLFNNKSYLFIYPRIIILLPSSGRVFLAQEAYVSVSKIVNTRVFCRRHPPPPKKRLAGRLCVRVVWGGVCAGWCGVCRLRPIACGFWATPKSCRGTIFLVFGSYAQSCRGTIFLPDFDPA